MKTKILIRYTSYVLLIAMQFGILPLQQIFHHHRIATIAENKTPLLKKYEKPCCKQFEVIIGTAAHDQYSVAVTPLYSENYLISSFSYSFMAHFQLANKAPPVV